jgi:predicted phosphodiesterase
MKIAIISDIHANLPALEQALKSLDEQQPDAVYCLGDLVGYNVWPNEVIRELRKRGIGTIAGNHDAKVKKLTADQLASGGKNYAYRVIGQSEKQYLASLPAHIRLEFDLNGQPLVLLLVHGSPWSNEEYLLQDKDENEFIQVFEESKADVLCFGHSHKQYHRVLHAVDGEKKRYYHAVNAGSVGKPKDGDNRGCYVLIDIDANSTIWDDHSIKVEFVRFEYDIEKAAQAVEQSPLPNEFGEMLRKAY